jgi:hypothetical protein
VFNTTDAFALDVFVVDGWSTEVRGAGPCCDLAKQRPATGLRVSAVQAQYASRGQRSMSVAESPLSPQAGESLEEQLGQRLLRMPPPVIPARGRGHNSGPNIDPGAAAAAAAAEGGAGPGPASGWHAAMQEPPPPGFVSGSGDGGGGVGPGAWANRVPGGSPAPDDWEIDISQLHIDSKVAAGGSWPQWAWRRSAFWAGVESGERPLGQLAAKYSRTERRLACWVLGAGADDRVSSAAAPLPGPFLRARPRRPRAAHAAVPQAPSPTSTRAFTAARRWRSRSSKIWGTTWRSTTSSSRRCP